MSSSSSSSQTDGQISSLYAPSPIVFYNDAAYLCPTIKLKYPHYILSSSIVRVYYTYAYIHTWYIYFCIVYHETSLYPNFLLLSDYYIEI